MILALAFLFLFITAANVLFWPRLRASGAWGGPGVSVLIPARNESENLGACLRSVLQQGASVQEVLIYDDHSTDDTAAIAQSTGDPRVHLLPPVPLPSGWYGKTFACAELAEAAAGGWLLFLDADARLEPDACDRMLAEAQRRKLTFLSCWPRLEMLSWPERILMPMLNFVVFSIFPGPLSLYRPDASLGLAHGACMLVERGAYARVGGHAVVRREIFEDTRMAQLWRIAGERGLCLDGAGVVRVRMYGSFRDICQGFTKNFYRAFRYPANFWMFLLLHFTVYLLPFFGVDWRAIPVVLAIRAILAIRFGQGWEGVLFHPVGEAVLLGVGIGSWWQSRSKAGVAWKGRRYPTPRG